VPRTPIGFFEVLEEDADDVLLGLLARDTEAPAWHGKPHRRYVYPPSIEPCGGSWRDITSDWWVWVTDEEYEIAIGVVASIRRNGLPAKPAKPAPTKAKPQPFTLAPWLFDALLNGGEVYQLWTYKHNGIVLYRAP